MPSKIRGATPPTGSTPAAETGSMCGGVGSWTCSWGRSSRLLGEQEWKERTMSANGSLLVCVLLFGTGHLPLPKDKPVLKCELRVTGKAKVGADQYLEDP